MDITLNLDNELLFQKFLEIFKSNKVCVVDFDKANGENRVMTCTLDPEILPALAVNEDKKSRHYSHSALAVYDVNKKDWRAFKVSSVKKISILDQETGKETVVYTKE